MAAPNMTFAELIAIVQRLQGLDEPPNYTAPSTYTTLEHITSGNYTPVASATQAGVTVTPALFRWFRIGDEVHLTGRIAVTTTTNAFTSCKLTLPFDGVLASQGNGVAALNSTRAPANVATALGLTLDSASLIACAATNSDIDAGTGPFEYQVSFAFTAA